MDKDLLVRMRTIWHVTSLSSAESIASSQVIHTKDIDGAANFHPNQSSKNLTHNSPEVSLGFYWYGDIDFKSYDDEEPIKDRMLTVYITSDIHQLSLESIKIWASKLKAENGKELELCDIAIFSDFNEKIENDSDLKKRYRNLQNLCRNKAFVKVP